ncbi:MAG: LacI family DNA-binding transcriptional regulator [Actinomycetota bacterium]|jgi:LacI family transcriptional regulator|nr:LacI family DNA-binding transcriptional regulator [Actinomycetota bacterium]
MKKNNVTLKDVAKFSGVSVPTVSRVVNKEKYVSDEVKEKVLSAIKELNYTPQWTARSLRLKRTHTIGIIIPNVSDYFFGSIVLAVENYFRKKNYDIILFNTSNDEDIEERAIKLAISKRVEGIILATISKNEKKISSLISNFGIPIVVVDNKLNIKNIDQVLSDDVGGSYKLVEHLIKQHGYKNIACISGPLEESSSFEKLRGYKKAMEDNMLTVDDSLIKVAYWKKSKAFEATRELMENSHKPEAIYCMNANMLIGCLRYIIEKKIMIPEDLALVTFDDYDFVSVVYPPVTSLKRIDIEMGTIAAEILFKRIEGCEEDYRIVRIDSDLVIRNSCGCA